MPKNKNFCHCDSKIKFELCCEIFLKNIQTPATPEQLMRSRYTAFCLSDMNYIQKTMFGKLRDDFNLNKSLAENKKCKWISLNIISSNTEDNIGFVEFIAQFSSYGKLHNLHEKSEFHFIKGHWYYVSGTILK